MVYQSMMGCQIHSVRERNVREKKVKRLEIRSYCEIENIEIQKFKEILTSYFSVSIYRL